MGILFSLECRASNKYKSYTVKSKFALFLGRIKTGTGLLRAEGDKVEMGVAEMEQIKSGNKST